jgi:hypothetical protein
MGGNLCETRAKMKDHNGGKVRRFFFRKEYFFYLFTDSSTKNNFRKNLTNGVFGDLLVLVCSEIEM